MRTLAARKAFDEPLDISIRRAEENRFHPYTRESSSTTSEDEVEGPINLEMPKEPTPPAPSPGGPPTQGGVYNNGELTIVRRAPSPPQSEPMDFSTKKKQPPSNSDQENIIRKPNNLMMSMSYTSTKELRFAKNLKILLVEIMRKHPVKAKVILNYLRFAWTKSKKNAANAVISQEVKVTSQVTATTGGQPQTFVQVSDGQGGNSSSTGSGSNQGSGGSSGGSGSGGGGASSGGKDDFFGNISIRIV